jgi:hypothetical protein
MSMSVSTVEALAALARQLPLAERARLIEQVAASLAEETGKHPIPRRAAYGVLADLHIDVSEEDIAEARRDMLANFPREDIA